MQFTFATSGVDLSRDDRAYLEYTVFTALSPYASGVRHVHIGLARSARTQRATCVITVLRHEGWLTARGSGDRLYAAAERAAARIASLAERRAVA